MNFIGLETVIDFTEQFNENHLANNIEPFYWGSEEVQRQASLAARTVKSNVESPDKMVAVCRKCQKTCLLNSKRDSDVNANPRCSGDWGQLSPTDPFRPIPEIAVMPPSPASQLSNNNPAPWHDSNFTQPTVDDDDSLSRDSFVENGEESEGEVEETPYVSLSPGGLRRYGTMSSLERLDSEEHPDQPPETTSQFEYVSQTVRGWTMRAGTYVAEKISFFDKPGDENCTSFIDRYLRTNPGKDEELMATTTNLAGEEEYETSGATSENDVWGTPTSGGSELTSPNTENGDSPVSSLDEGELALMEQLLGGGGLVGAFSSHIGLGRMSATFPPRTRLEPLPEDEEETTSSTTTPELSDTTKSCYLDQGNKSDGCPSRARSATSTPRFLDKLKLRRSQSADSRPNKPNRFMEFLRSSKSEEHTSSSSSKRLMRLFSRDCSQDDILTTLPPDLAAKQQEKPMERRFWKQLYRRKSSSNSSSGSKSNIPAT